MWVKILKFEIRPNRIYWSLCLTKLPLTHNTIIHSIYTPQRRAHFQYTFDELISSMVPRRVTLATVWLPLNRLFFIFYVIPMHHSKHKS